MYVHVIEGVSARMRVCAHVVVCVRVRAALYA